MCRMIIIFNEVLDLAPPVELIFNMGLMASQWPQSLWPPDEPIGLRCINNVTLAVLKLELKVLSLLESHVGEFALLD